MTDNTQNKIVQLLQQLVVQKATAQSQPWTSYGGVNTSGPITLIQQAQRQIQTALGSFGPLGQLAGPYVAQWLTGKDFNKTGTLNNPLSGLLTPGSGTYASAVQRLNRQQQLAVLQGSRDRLGKDLRKQFYTNYYTMTMGDKSTSDQINSQVEKAMKNMVSIPAALQFIFDPAKNERILRGVKNTQAGYLHWQDRVDPLGKLDFDKKTGNAGKIGQEVASWAMQANRFQLGKGQGGWKNSYGGFSGAQVTQLTSILANTSNVFGTDSSEQGIKTAIDNLKQKVKGLTQALAPLKDIFGTDVKAMVDMIQSVTGQNINQLSPTMVSSIARSTVDMARYSGATVTQIAQAGQQIFLQSSQMGGNSFSRIGANLTGGLYSALLAQGNTPAGVHAAQYAGFAKKALASAQASAGVDWTAMAYGLWAEKNGGKEASIDDFMQKVREKRAARGGTLMDAVIATAGVKNQQELLRGQGTSGYRTSLQSGRLVQLGIQGQYYTQVGDSIAAMKRRYSNFGASEWDKFGKFLADDKNAALVKQLATNGDDQTIERVAKAAGLNIESGEGIRMVNTFLNKANMQSYMSAWSTGKQAAQYMKTQKDFRDATEDLDAGGTGALLSFWKAASEGTWNTDGSFTFSNGKKVGARAIQMQMRAVLGTSDKDEVKTRLQNVKKVFGDQRGNEILALASGQFAQDKQYLQAVRRVAQTGDKASDADRGYIEARRLGYLGKQAEFKSDEAKSVRQQALEKFQKSNKDKNAKAQLDKDYARALRVQNLSQMSASQLGFTGADADNKRQKLLKKLRGNRGMSLETLLKKEGEDFNKAAKVAGLDGISKEQLRAAYQASGVNYNNQTDVNKLLSTTLSLLMKWLQQHWDKKD